MMLSRDSVADAFLFSRLCRTDAFRFIAFGCRGADGVSSFEVDADMATDGEGVPPERSLPVLGKERRKDQ